MKHFFPFGSPFKNQITTGLWIVFSVCFILLSACKEEEEQLPEGFNRVAGFQLIAQDSIFLVTPGEQELRLSPQFIGAFGDEVTLTSLPSMQLFIDGKRASNPLRIKTDKAKIFEVSAKIGQLTSKPLKIKVIDVNPKTYVSSLKVSMGDSTKSPYAIAGKSLVDFHVSILDYRGKEFFITDRPAFKFYFDGVQVENLQRVPVTRSGEIPFWLEVGDKKSEVKILNSREMPDFSKKYSLPIVFHIVHAGQEIGILENPSQERIHQLFRESNDWLMGKQRSMFRTSHNQVDPNIEFHMATVGPDGNFLEEPGIHRISSDRQYFQHQAETTSKFLFDQMWNPNEYVNVFVLNITDAGGFAFHTPAFDPTSSDNVITRFYGFAISKDLIANVFLHELGHFLSLSHTFSEGQICEDRDRFPDTESYNNDFKKTNNYLKTNCEGEYFFATNYMDYPPSVRNSFTLDQVTEMRNTLKNGYFLPVNKNPNERRKPQPWKRGVFDPTVKPID